MCPTCHQTPTDWVNFYSDRRSTALFWVLFPIAWFVETYQHLLSGRAEPSVCSVLPTDIYPWIPPLSTLGYRAYRWEQCQLCVWPPCCLSQHLSTDWGCLQAMLVFSSLRCTIALIVQVLCSVGQLYSLIHSVLCSPYFLGENFFYVKEKCLVEKMSQNLKIKCKHLGSFKRTFCSAWGCVIKQRAYCFAWSCVRLQISCIVDVKLCHLFISLFDYRDSILSIVVSKWAVFSVFVVR